MLTSSMVQATTTVLEGNKVRLSVEVSEEEFSKAFDAAVEEMAESIRLPGFRPGRVPKRLVVSRVGKQAVREEAIKDSVPRFLQDAASEAGLDVIGAPEVDITSDPSDPVLRFDAVVLTRPKVSIAGYQGLKVTVPSPVPTDQEIDRQVDRMRDSFGELHTVNRPARDGDHLTIEMSAHRHSEQMEDLDLDDFVYELGSGGLVSGLDEQLAGAKAGDIFAFNAPHPRTGEEVSVRVLVKEVKEKVLPEPDDAWAAEASEFETIEELRADISRQIAEIKKLQTRLALRSEAARALADLVDEELPEVLVSEEMLRRIDDLRERLHAQGATLEQYVAFSGQSPDEFLANVKSAAEANVRLDLALRALIEAEKIEATEEEIADRIARLAESSGQRPDVLRSRLEEAGRLEALDLEVRKAKALEWLVDHVEAVDEEGRPVDPASLAPSDDSGGPGSEPAPAATGSTTAVAGAGPAKGRKEESEVPEEASVAQPESNASPLGNLEP